MFDQGIVISSFPPAGTTTGVARVAIIPLTV